MEWIVFYIIMLTLFRYYKIIIKKINLINLILLIKYDNINKILDILKLIWLEIQYFLLKKSNFIF